MEGRFNALRRFRVLFPATRFHIRRLPTFGVIRTSAALLHTRLQRGFLLFHSTWFNSSKLQSATHFSRPAFHNIKGNNFQNIRREALGVLQSSNYHAALADHLTLYFLAFFNIIKSMRINSTVMTITVTNISISARQAIALIVPHE